VFGNDAWTIAIKDLLEGGAFSYQYGSWLQLAMDLLRRKRIPTNKFL
jgi:hypothetical protein